MEAFVKILINYLKVAIFTPKDRFERIKRSTTKRLIYPLISFAILPSLFNIFSSISLAEFRYHEIFLKILGSASNDTLYIAFFILLAFGAVLGSNLWYSFFLKKIEKDMIQLEQHTNRAKSYMVIKQKFENHMSNDDAKKAIALATFMLNYYKEEALSDTDFIQKLTSITETNFFNQLVSTKNDSKQLPQ